MNLSKKIIDGIDIAVKSAIYESSDISAEPEEVEYNGFYMLAYYDLDDEAYACTIKDSAKTTVDTIRGYDTYVKALYAGQDYIDVIIQEMLTYDESRKNYDILDHLDDEY